MSGHYRSRFVWRFLPGAALATLFWVGCSPTCFVPTQVDDVPIVNLAVSAGDQAMNNGATLEDVIRAAVSAVENNPQVAAAAVDDQDPRNAWILYTSGTEHFLEAIDLDEEFTPTPQNAMRTVQDIPIAAGASHQAKNASSAQSIPGLNPFWRTPANRNALLVNALTRCHTLRDIRPTVKAMLSDRGYAVADTVPLDIDLFRNNNLMKYGVIFMETHGGIRTQNQRYMEQIQALLNKLVGKNVPYCAGPGGAYVISTDVLLSPDITQQYRDDLDCGLLKYTTTYIRQGGKSVPCVTTYGVTPDFIRRYNTARFDDRTLVCMNACRTYSPGGDSEWSKLFSERCTGYHMLGWDRRVHYDTSATAFLNLFQLATGSDSALTTIVAGLSDPVDLLLKNVPPVGVSPVLSAALALSSRGYDVDSNKGKRKGTGARFVFSMDPQPDSPFELVLAPDVRDFFIDQTGMAGLTAACQDHAEIRIAHEQTQSGVTTADIGTYGVYSIGGGWFGGVGLWVFPLPVGSAGPISLVQDGRSGPTHEMLRWTPTFRVTGSGPHQMRLTVDFKMHVRAIPGPRWRSGKVGLLAWDKPTDQFDAKFDGGASVVTWSVSGGEEDPPGVTTYVYSGGGTANLSFVDTQGGVYRAQFSSSDGKTAVADFDCSTILPYKETITDIGTGHSTINDHMLPIAGLALQSLALGGDWTIQPGTAPIGLSGGLTGTVSWGAAAPTPRFDSDLIRR